MEEYLQYVKTLRSQMNDVEDQAAKVSVEEQMQITTIQTLERDLDHARSELKKLEDETEQMMRRKGGICSQILEKQRKISSMESDSSTLAQTLELIQQERLSISAKLAVKRSDYAKIAEDTRTKLEEQQGWFVSHGSKESGKQGQQDERGEKVMKLLDSAKAKLDETRQMKSDLIQENNKMRLLIKNQQNKANEFKPELSSMDTKILEEEYTALSSDESGETEYLHSLRGQTEKLKGVSYISKCGCGEEYTVSAHLHS
ncbi:PREDICTED: uncharacterized protein LOC104815798 [Tarenaya hassleriana]|uniref:uncharacterized protein LOC104815798 n=1 Tax=Tarenaya hassleriana TaxID=28532 RepID=UPI00053C951E|nr:PREDICTED: uncharacterized protein LOC104815798 [Tarenaya hassleriana]